MATIRRTVTLSVPPAEAWAHLRDVDTPHRLFAGVLTDAHRDGDERVVTFADGTVARELLVTVDDDQRRVAYSVVNLFRHHHAAFVVHAAGDGCVVEWTADLLPDSAVPRVAELMDEGMAALRRTIDGG